MVRSARNRMSLRPQQEQLVGRIDRDGVVRRVEVSNDTFNVPPHAAPSRRASLQTLPPSAPASTSTLTFHELLLLISGEDVGTERLRCCHRAGRAHVSEGIIGDGHAVIALVRRGGKRQEALCASGTVGAA